MIRKIVIAFVALFIVTWLALAHIAKSKIMSFITKFQTDNTRIWYSDTSIEGFPFSWKVRFISPKITIINQDISREISSNYMDCTFDYKLKKAKLNFGKDLYYNSSTDDSLAEYKISSEQDIIGCVDFIDLLYKIDVSNSIRNIVKNIEFTNPYIAIFTVDGEELFNLSGITFKLSTNLINNIENFLLNLAGNYKSSFSGRKVSTAAMVLNAHYAVNIGNREDIKGNNFDYTIEIKNSKFNFDNASCSFTGSVALARHEIPKGKISVKLVEYENLVNILVPDDFIFSKSYVKRFIAKAAAIKFSNTITNVVNFDIEFSDKGIVVGHANYLKQKGH